MRSRQKKGQIIPIAKPDLSRLERKKLLAAFESSWISSTGPFIEEFESSWAMEIGSKHALTVANGTVALHLILDSLEIGPGDEVIVPSLTFVATINAIVYTGAKPVFVDVEKARWGLNPSEVEKAISKRTKAVIAVHLYGQICEIEELSRICQEHNLFLVEDAAEAPFSTLNGKRAGTFGIAASFSFYGNKVLTCGEGGAITTSDYPLMERMRKRRGQGMGTRRYYFDEIGFNYRLTNLQCAILSGQLARAKDILRKRENIYKLYTNYLDWNLFEDRLLRENETLTPWLFTIITKQKGPLFQSELLNTLKYHGVETRPLFIPIHVMPPYKSYRRFNMYNTTQISERGFSLPTFSGLSRSKIEFIADVMNSTIRKLQSQNEN